MSYAERISDKSDPQHNFTGIIARLVLADDRVIEKQVIITGLPHERERHLGAFVMLAPEEAGLLDASVWTRSKQIALRGEWFDSVSSQYLENQ